MPLLRDRARTARHLVRGIAPALSLVGPALLIAVAGCGRIADRVSERMGTETAEVVGEDWPPNETPNDTHGGLDLPPWMLPPMLRGQGGGPPILGPDDHELIPSPLNGPGEELEDEEDLDDEGLAAPPEEERGHEDFL